MSDDGEFFLPKKKIFLVTPEDIEEESWDFDRSQEVPEEPLNQSDQKLAAEIAVFLEDDLQVDTRRLYIRAQKGHVYLQGTVESEEKLKEIQSLLEQKPDVRGVEVRLRVQRSY